MQIPFEQIFPYLFVFLRLASVIMMMPGIGDVYVPMRIRFFCAIGLSCVVTPVVAADLPMVQHLNHHALFLMFTEIAIGIFMGSIVRMATMVLNVGGQIISLQSSLGNAALLNPSSGVQDPIISGFLGTCGMLFIFLTDTHYLIFDAFIRSYEVLVPHQHLFWEDMFSVVIRIFNHAFYCGVKMSLPFVLMGTVLYVSFGFLNRLMPQFHVFMVGMPLQILLTFILLSVGMVSILRIFMGFIDQLLLQPIVEIA